MEVRQGNDECIPEWETAKIWFNQGEIIFTSQKYNIA